MTTMRNQDNFKTVNDTTKMSTDRHEEIVVTASIQLNQFQSKILSDDFGNFNQKCGISGTFDARFPKRIYEGSVSESIDNVISGLSTL
jgi:hypothetical protein